MTFRIPGDPTHYRLVKLYIVRVGAKCIQCVRGVSADGAEQFAHFDDVEMLIA